LNDKFVDIRDIKPFVLEEMKLKGDKLVTYMTTSLRVDKNTNMGIVRDIKKELRDLQLLRINYTTKRGDPILNLQ